jgi:hypothetical protein
MLLGDIFYYDKELDKFPSQLSAQNLGNIQIFGLGELNPDQYLGMSDRRIRQAIKDNFINQFTILLSQSSLTRSQKIWKELTSPTFKTHNQTNNFSQFQQSILDWIWSGQSDQGLLELVNETKTLTEEEDLTLGYALKVIYKLSTLQSGDSHDIAELKPGKLTDTAADSPQILILTEPQFFPLFSAQGCLTTAFVKDPRIISHEIKKILETTPSISLVMLDSDQDNLVSHLQKDLGSRVFVTSFNLASNETSQQTTFFDQVVRATLGVRLG